MKINIYMDKCMHVQIYIYIQIISKYSYISLYLYLYVMIMYIYKYLFVKYLYIYIYIYFTYLFAFVYLCIFVYLFIYCVHTIYIMCLFLWKCQKNIKSTTRHLKFSYISIFTNLLWTDNEMKSVKTIYNYVN